MAGADDAAKYVYFHPLPNFSPRIDFRKIQKHIFKFKSDLQGLTWWNPKVPEIKGVRVELGSVSWDTLSDK